MPSARRDDGCGSIDTADRHALEVYLAVDRAGRRVPLCPGEALSDADVLWVTVELDTASHVRMVFVTPDGDTGELLRQDAADLTREALFRAPSGLMTRALGEAQLVIVASNSPLSQADPLLASMLDVIRETGTLVDRDGSLRPPPAGSERADLPLNFGAQALHADFDDNGVALLTLSLRAAH